MIRSSSPESRRAQAKAATSTRHLGSDHPATVAAQAEFRSERWLAAVQAAVDEAPATLTPEQEIRLTALIQPVLRLLPRVASAVEIAG